MTYLYFVLLENGETVASCFLQGSWGLDPWSTSDEGNTIIPLVATTESHGIQHIAYLITIIRLRFFRYKRLLRTVIYRFPRQQSSFSSSKYISIFLPTFFQGQPQFQPQFLCRYALSTTLTYTILPSILLSRSIESPSLFQYSLRYLT